MTRSAFPNLRTLSQIDPLRVFWLLLAKYWSQKVNPFRPELSVIRATGFLGGLAALRMIVDWEMFAEGGSSDQL